MRVLVGCESSGRVREAFAAKGHEAWSCDLLATEKKPTPPPGGWTMLTRHTIKSNVGPGHIIGDVLQVLRFGYPWDLFICHPPCTFIASSGLHWNKRRPGRSEETEKALRFVEALLDFDLPRRVLENPIGAINTRIEEPTQIIQPWWFGDDASKATCLWLKGVPPLKPTNRLPGARGVHPRAHRRANQTASGQNKLTPSPDRWKLRSETYPGIARAMADQWGSACPFCHYAPVFDDLFGCPNCNAEGLK